MSILHIPTQSDVPSTGWWGPATSVHQFCEPKYATSPYFAEFYNSLSSFIFVVAAAYMLSKPETRKDPLILLTILSVAAIGLGSVAFHATMLFEYELCDEVPMLIMIGLALLNKCHAHPLLLTRGRCAAYTACVTTAIGITIWIYAKLALYDFFVASFTALVVADTALGYTWRSTQRVASWARNASLLCIVSGKLLWEVEVRLCAADGRVWPLHVLWHVLSCASAYYGVLADLASRIDCGLSQAPTAQGVVKLSWLGVPFDEVRVVCGQWPPPAKGFKMR